MKNKKVVIASILAMLLIFAGLGFMFKQAENQKRISLMNSQSTSPFYHDKSPQFGENQANVVIVEYFDPACIACKGFHSSLKKVFNEYEKEVKLVYRYLDFHPNSIYAIRILEASRNQNKFNETLDFLYNQYNVWSSKHANTPNELWNIIPSSIDKDRLLSDFEKTNVSDLIVAERRDASKLGVRGTPTVFVNGQQLQSLQYKSLLDLVENTIYK